MANVNIYAPTAQDGLNAAEIALYDDLMAYRSQLGLPAIPLSKALTTTAARHVVDIADNLGTPVPDQSPGENRAHSWSDAPYNAKDSNTYANMWTAPARVGTGYAGYGFENLITGTGTVVRSTPEQTASVLLNAWKMSPGHNAVMTNQGDWKSYSWNAVGVAIYKNSAAVWFGREADPTGQPTIDNFNPLRYLASHTDLMNAFGTNQQAAKDHYLGAGAREGRATDTFKPAQYLAGYTDLMAAFGTDTTAAEFHYITNGRFEGRSDHAFNTDGYLAGNGDLLAAFGSDREAAAQHYIAFGRNEGRSTTAFDAQAYEQANPDVARAFGSDLAAATRHYVDNGYREGRQIRPAMTAQHAAIDLFQSGTDDAATLPQHAAINDFQTGTNEGLLFDSNPFAGAPATDAAPLVITAGLDAYRTLDTANLLGSSTTLADFGFGGASRDYTTGLLAAI